MSTSQKWQVISIMVYGAEDETSVVYLVMQPDGLIYKAYDTLVQANYIAGIFNALPTALIPVVLDS
jgi:hypothetical protein